MTPAHENVAARYRQKGDHATADRVLAGEDGFWAVRYEQVRLEREAENERR